MSRSSKSPLRQDQLRQRKDVDNADIPEIIDRAERLRQHHNQKIEQDNKRSSIQDVKQVGRDLSIPDNFIEQAIVELRKERNKAKVAQQSEVEERQASNKAFRLWTSKVIRLLGVVVGLIVLLRGVQWLWYALDFTPEQVEPTEPDIIVQERIVKETVLQTVKTVVEDPVKVAESVKATEPVQQEQPTHIIKKATKTVGVMVSTKDTSEMDSASLAPSIPTEEPSQNLSVEEEVADINKASELEKEPSDNSPIQEPVVEVIEPDPKVPTVAKEEPLPRLTSRIEGEWVLDAYLLYEKGVELPMEVPIVYEPLELPKTWRFTSGKYKRVMDTNLSFTARFEMMTLPDSIRPNLDEPGEWGQIVASNVVSSIPGIRRQNDYFAVLVGKNTITIWYLGPNAYRKKVPTQAERYVRK